jgi:predicted GNAT superfamily acetyltransferase
MRFLSWWYGKVGGHVFGAYDGPDGRFLLRHPGHQARTGAVPAQPHAGRAAGVPQRANRPAAQAAAARGALARGIELIEWTFDPLELKNAFFNIERLGAIVRRYKENQYGTTASPLHGGLPTDRCIAEWWIDSPRVRACWRAKRWRGAEESSASSYPADIARIRSQDPPRARNPAGQRAPFPTPSRAGWP